jgi:hypothetical protein
MEEVTGMKRKKTPAKRAEKSRRGAAPKRPARPDKPKAQPQVVPERTREGTAVKKPPRPVPAPKR